MHFSFSVGLGGRLPLRRHTRLDYVAGAGALRDDHRVVLLAAVQAQLRQPDDDGITCAPANHV